LRDGRGEFGHAICFLLPVTTSPTPGAASLPAAFGTLANSELCSERRPIIVDMKFLPFDGSDQNFRESNGRRDHWSSINLAR